MTTDFQEPKTSSQLRTTVRFTEPEFQQIQSDSNVTGKSLPTLLKETYFVGSPMVPLMSKEDQRTLLGQLGKIGNNINQIARALNSGFRAGFYNEILEVRTMFDQLLSFVTRTYGKKES